MVNVTKLMILRWEDHSDYLGGPCDNKAFIKRETKVSESERERYWKMSCRGFEGRGQGYKLRNASGFQKLEKAKKHILRRASRNWHSPDDTLILAHWDWLPTFDLQSYFKINLCYFKPLNFWKFVTEAVGNEQHLASCPVAESILAFLRVVGLLGTLAATLASVVGGTDLISGSRMNILSRAGRREHHDLCPSDRWP